MGKDNNVVKFSETEEAQQEAVLEAKRASKWWNGEWLKFPTVSRDADGQWYYWDVPDDTGCFQDDWPLGETLARQTVAQMQRFTEGSTVLRRILRDMDFETTVAQGFLASLEDLLAYPDLYSKVQNS